VSFAASYNIVGIGYQAISATDGLYFVGEDGQILMSIDDQNWYIDPTWPVVIINNTGGTLTTQFSGTFALNGTVDYFILGSDDINITGENDINGGPAVFNVSSVTNYHGVFSNGGGSANSNIDISNIFVNSIGSTLQTNGGWIGQAGFGNGGTNNTIENCGSNGSIPINGGGIIGEASENVTITNCFSTGNIGTNAGGIVGSSATDITVNNSYSMGTIAASAGGIIGGNSTSCSIGNSYSRGNMGASGGGIFGPTANGGTATNSYSIGAIGTNAGGIFGASATNPVASGDYTSGVSSGNTGGIISGSTTDGAGNYSETDNSGSSWNDTHAASVLTELNTWISLAANTPFVLDSFNSSPYAQSSQTVAKEGSSTAVLSNYDSCAIVSITGGTPSSYSGFSINTSTGVISTANSVVDGTYDVLVNCDTLQSGYSISTLNLTVSD
jgi:hypothetical protein